MFHCVEVHHGPGLRCILPNLWDNDGFKLFEWIWNIFTKNVFIIEEVRMAIIQLYLLDDILTVDIFYL